MIYTCDNCFRSYDEETSTAQQSQTYCSHACEVDAMYYCEVCDKGYYVQQSSATDQEAYCSSTCEQKHQASCKKCATTYNVKLSSAADYEDYCSYQCEGADTKQCTHCATKYRMHKSTAQQQQSFCSEACERIATHEEVCEQCQTSYFVVKSDAQQPKKYCSEACELLFAEHEAQKREEERLQQQQLEQERARAIELAAVQQVMQAQEQAIPSRTTRQKNNTLPSFKLPIKRKSKKQQPTEQEQMPAQQQVPIAAEPIQSMQPPKLSSRELSNQLYMRKTKRFIVWYIIYTIVFLFMMRDFISISSSFSLGISEGFIALGLIAIKILFIISAFFKVLRGIFAPFRRFKYYTGIILVVVGLALLQQLMLGNVVLFDVFDRTQTSIQSGAQQVNSISDSIRNFLNGF